MHFKLGVSNHIKGECINGRGKWKPNTELSLYIFESLQRLDSFQSDSSSSDGYDYRTEIILDNIGNGFDPTKSSQYIKRRIFITKRTITK